MEKMKYMKEILEHSALEEMEHLNCVDTEELSEVIDMIKDIEEAMYYHSIRKSMEDSSEAHYVKSYKELKESHADKATLMAELECYMNAMSEIVGMATPEEKIYLTKKISSLYDTLTPHHTTID